jgi:RecB family exonuclease
MATGELHFDEATHTYTVDGVEYPSVTTILKDVGLIDTSGPWYTDWHRDRGTQVHKALELFDDGDLDEESLDDEIRPYLDAWDRFLTETRCEMMYLERRVVDPELKFAGTIDRIVYWLCAWWVLDIKTGPHEPWHALQTAAYARLARYLPQAPLRFGRATISLAGGKLSVKTHESFNDEALFRSALALYHWKRNAE